jgi:hypothetical protein
LNNWEEPNMLRALVVAAAVIATALAGAQASSAARVGLVKVSGTWTATDFGALNCAPIGSSTFLIRCSTTNFKSAYDGSLQGESTVDFTQTIDCLGGFTYGSGLERFSGSIAGVGTGTVTWQIFFYSAFDCTTFSLSGFKALAVIQSGTGDLAGVRGTLFFDDVSYWGVLRL